LLITLPAAIALALLAKPIVSILYERGAFTADDANAVAAVLRVLAFGLPAFVLVKVFLPAFLAREDMKSPLMAAVLGVTTNIGVALLLFPHFGFVAAAIGVSASAVVNAVTLYIMLVRKGRFRPDRLARQRIPRVLLASALTGLSIWVFLEFARPLLKSGHPFSVRVLVLSGLCSASILTHLVLIHILKATDLSQIRGTFKK
jgi:putative peptidoglycan lipid II flippase